MSEAGRPFLTRQRVDLLLADYASFHRTGGNRLCHAFGISLIVFGALALLGRIPLFADVTAAEALLAASALFYVALDARLAIATITAAAGLDLAAHAASWKLGLTAFVLGWVFQGIGHARFEKNSPAFFRNLVHLLVGPLFLVNEAIAIRPRTAAAASR